MRKRVVIGTRGSELALWQANFVKSALQERYPKTLTHEYRIKTKGDKILDAPLSKIGGKGLFTKELEEAMLAGKIDIAVHSLKDMPVSIPDGLTLAAVTRREEPWDAFVSERFDSLDSLPPGAKVGTSSLRRRAQILARRPDLVVENLRGNVGTRLRRLDAGDFDAIILAAAGLRRLGFWGRVKSILPSDVLLPAVGQGALAIEARADDYEMLDMLSFLNDEKTARATGAERSFLETVEGGCQVPVGVYAEADDEKITIEAVIASLDGRRVYRDSMTGDAPDVGRLLARRLLASGGLGILQELGLMA